MYVLFIFGKVNHFIFQGGLGCDDSVDGVSFITNLKVIFSAPLEYFMLGCDSNLHCEYLLYNAAVLINFHFLTI